MTTLEIIRKCCREQGITLSSLEKKLGYSNGSLAKSSNISFDRIIEISEYFHLPTDYFIPGNDKESIVDVHRNYYVDKQTSEAAQKMYENPELRALFDAADGVPKNVLVSVYNLLMSMKQHERGDSE